MVFKKKAPVVKTPVVVEPAVLPIVLFPAIVVLMFATWARTYARTVQWQMAH